MVNHPANLTADNVSVLVVEDETHIAEGLRLNLQRQGYHVHIAGNAHDALSAWQQWRPSLIVLDIMLPGADGFAILQHIRLHDERLPILILSARSSVEDRIKGLSFGVDDYLAKPFHLEEFLLRVDRLLKRDRWRTDRTETTEATSIYVFGENTIDFQNGLGHRGPQSFPLTEQELRLLRLLIANKGKVLTRGEILSIAWGTSSQLSTRTIDNFVARFRKYFETDPKHPIYFKSRRSVGYLFDHP